MRYVIVGIVVLWPGVSSAAIVAQGPFGPPSITANPPHSPPMHATGNFGHVGVTGVASTGHGNFGHGK